MVCGWHKVGCGVAMFTNARGPPSKALYNSLYPFVVSSDTSISVVLKRLKPDISNPSGSSVFRMESFDLVVSVISIPVALP